MAANVETMMYVGREKPWHGLGTQVDEAPGSEEALRLAGLDWEIESKPIFDASGKLIAGYKANTRSTDGSVLGVVSNKYKLVQNREAFEFTDALIGEGVKYETAGSLRGGRQIWLLARMPERKIAGDAFEPYICFTNTHDGSGAVRACMTPIRVVCNNTLNMALRGAQRSWSTPHRGNVAARLDEARQTLGLAELYLQRLAEQADRLANEKMTEGDMMQALNQMFPVAEDASDRQKRNAQAAKDGIIICTLAPDLLQFAGTKWGFLNAVSDYGSHADPARKTKTYDENRWGNIINGRWMLDRAMAAVGAAVE